MKLQKNKFDLFLSPSAFSKSLFICTLVIITTCIFFVSESFSKSKAPKTPFIGEITSNAVNVRAGQSANFEKLVQLEKGDTVLVVDAQYSWYKIRLPKNAKIYISKKYLEELSDKKAIVLGDKVNIRSGPDVKNSIIGQLKRGDQVEIVEVKEDWYQIAPWEESYGWVSEDLVKFNSSDLASASLSVGTVAGKSRDADLPKDVLKEPVIVVSEDNTFIRLKGEVEITPLVPFPATHVLKSGTESYYLSAPADILSEFFKKQVKVEGKIKNQNPSDGSPPIVYVTKIELIL